MIPRLVDGRNKLFFFANYSYVNDYIPGKNQGSSTIPANAAQLNGDFSDLLRLPNPAQYQIYDPLTVHRDPANPNRFIRDPFPNNIIPANRIVNPLFNLYKQMVPQPNQNFVENGTTPTGNYYRADEPDKSRELAVCRPRGLQLSPTTIASSSADRTTALSRPVNDWTYEVPEFAGLHSIRPVAAAMEHGRQLDAHVRDRWCRTRQFAANHFLQGDLLQRAHRVQAHRHGPAGVSG